VGLFELPKNEVPPDPYWAATCRNDLAPPGGYDLVECASEDPDIEVWVARKFLSPEYVREGSLVFNIEGHGRFRLWIADVQ